MRFFFGALAGLIVAGVLLMVLALCSIASERAALDSELRDQAQQSERDAAAWGRHASEISRRR